MAINRMEIGVAGVTFEGRQALLMDLYHRGQERGVPLVGELTREPHNRYDALAIRVHVRNQAEGGWQHVGYVPRELAAKLAPRIDAGELPRVTAVRILEGKHDYRIVYGVRIDVECESPESAEKEAVSCPQQHRLF